MACHRLRHRFYSPTTNTPAGKSIGKSALGLSILIVGLALFIGAHVFVTRREARAAVIARIGNAAYKGLFSLVAAGSLVMIGVGYARYRAAGQIELWEPPAWTHYAAIMLMWFSIVSLVAAYIPGVIRTRLKHPILIGVKLWALAHLLANGDVGSVVLFGAILLWAGFDRMTLKSRNEPQIPLMIAQGRTNDLVAVLIGTIIYLAVGYVFHPLWIGTPVFGTPALGT